MPDVPTLITPRLKLRRLELADGDAIQRVFPQWEVLKFMGATIAWPYPEDGASSYVRDIAVPAMREGREWHWTIRPLDQPGLLIGMISLMDQRDDNRGFWLDPDRQGQGLMSEACQIVTRFWFETLGKPVPRVPKAIANTGSRRISERSGMRIIRSGERNYVSGRQPAELWELAREAWLCNAAPISEQRRTPC